MEKKIKIKKGKKITIDDFLQKKHYEESTCIPSNIKEADINKFIKSLDNEYKTLNKEFLSWIFGLDKKTDKKEEDIWGKKMLEDKFRKKVKTNWSTLLTEKFMKEFLSVILNEKISDAKILIENPHGRKNFSPDIKTEKYFFEVKSRTYHTTGTIGEKCIGTAKKYNLIKRLTNKRIFVILLAQQEIEACEDFRLFGLNEKDHPEDYKFMQLTYECGVSFIKLSDLFHFYLSNE
jgi:hypothetical protein